MLISIADIVVGLSSCYDNDDDVTETLYIHLTVSYPIASFSFS